MRVFFMAILACVVLGSVQSFGEPGYLAENDIAYCEESYGHYKLLGDYEFLEREKRTIEARVCVHLYNDPLWSYSKSDRLEKLLERGNYYVDVEIAQSKENAKTGVVPQEKPADSKNTGDKILELEKKVGELEKKLAQKDAIIYEQIKVIMNLANKLKSAILEIPSALSGIF